jgi:hypothetical protein
MRFAGMKATVFANVWLSTTAALYINYSASAGDIWTFRPGDPVPFNAGESAIPVYFSTWQIWLYPAGNMTLGDPADRRGVIEGKTMADVQKTADAARRFELFYKTWSEKAPAFAEQFGPIAVADWWVCDSQTCRSAKLDVRDLWVTMGKLLQGFANGATRDIPGISATTEAQLTSRSSSFSPEQKARAATFAAYVRDLNDAYTQLGRLTHCLQIGCADETIEQQLPETKRLVWAARNDAERYHAEGSGNVIDGIQESITGAAGFLQALGELGKFLSVFDALGGLADALSPPRSRSPAPEKSARSQREVQNRRHVKRRPSPTPTPARHGH